MHPELSIEAIIRNVRYSRWPTITVAAVVVGLFIGLCGLANVADKELILFVTTAISVVSLAVAVVIGLFAAHVARELLLGQLLQAIPGGAAYLPVDIARIEFTADPREDYDESTNPMRFCQIRVRPVRRFIIYLVSTVSDARLLREWAVRNHVTFTDVEGVLDASPVDPRKQACD